MMKPSDSSSDMHVVASHKTTPPVHHGGNVTPAVGRTPPHILACDAATGRRGAAWRLLQRIVEDDPQAVTAVVSLEDDRLAQYLLEFIALGTWAGKPFVLPMPLRSAHIRKRLYTLFLPDAGMDTGRVERVLLAAVHDKRPAMREAGIHILGLVGGITATSVLIEALTDPVHMVSLQAAKALGQSGNPSAIPVLLKALHGADEQMGNQICSALVRFAHAAVPAVLAESTNPSAWIRWHCMYILGEIGDNRAIPVLTDALCDSDHAVAWIAAKGLVRFGKLSIGPVLRLLLATDASPWLVETASYVLRDLDHRDPSLKHYLESVVQDMHGVAYRVATPTAVQKALTQLIADGLVEGPS